MHGLLHRETIYSVITWFRGFQTLLHILKAVCSSLYIIRTNPTPANTILSAVL
jgi:hypothetical protein